MLVLVLVLALVLALVLVLALLVLLCVLAAVAVAVAVAAGGWREVLKFAGVLQGRPPKTPRGKLLKLCCKQIEFF